MKKFMTVILIGVILVTVLAPTGLLPTNQALATVAVDKTDEGVRASWFDAQVQVGEFTLSDFELVAVNSQERGNKQTILELNYALERDGEPLCLGCQSDLTTTNDVLQINGFKSATLSPVTLDVCVAWDFDFNCIETFPVTLQAEWEGFGPVEAGVVKFGSVATFSHRLATATGSLNGEDLGQSTTDGTTRIFR